MSERPILEEALRPVVWNSFVLPSFDVREDDEPSRIPADLARTSSPRMGASFQIANVMKLFLVAISRRRSLRTTGCLGSVKRQGAPGVPPSAGASTAIASSPTTLFGLDVPASWPARRSSRPRLG